MTHSEQTSGGIVLQGVSKAFGETRVIDDLSLTLSADEFVVFLGPSGCGKSTLLRMIAGLETIDAGEIWIDGRRVDGLPPGERRVAMVFQHYALYPHMSVRDNLAFGLRNVRVPAGEIARRVSEAAKMLEIEHLLDRKPAQISGGQRQRVAIGRAIVKEPKAFLFDEPLSNLDAALRVRTRLEIANLHQRVKAAMIFVTHDQVEAMTLAHRIVVMNNCRIEQIGTPMEIYARPATLFVAGFVGTPAMNVIPVGRADAEGGYFAAALADGARVRTRVPLASLDARGPLKLGVRAESISVGAPQAGDTRGAVSFIERLGDRTLLYVKLADSTTVVAQVDGMSRISIGEPVGLSFDAGAIHLFSEQRAYHAEEARVTRADFA
jgi:multiple sugar transport system ATP-binding protein